MTQPQRKLRLALAQISSLPAYSTLVSDYTQEPSPPPGETPQPILAPLVGQPRFAQLARTLGDAHLSDLRLKALHIIQAVEPFKPHLLCFPEYSIPRALLGFIAEQSKRTGITIVAGSHLVQTSEAALEEYRNAGFVFIAKAPAEFTRKALCPVFFPNSNISFWLKRHPSKWEPDLVLADDPHAPLVVGIDGTSTNVDLRICIDALAGSGLENADAMIAIARSPSKSPFGTLFHHLTFTEVPCALVNAAEYGGTSIYVNSSMPRDDLQALSRIDSPDEAVLIADLHLDEQHARRGSTVTTRPATLHARMPLLFFAARDHAVAFDAVYSLTMTNVAEVFEKVVRLKEAPAVLHENLRTLKQSFDLGTLTAQELGVLGQAIAIPQTVLPFANRCSQALTRVMQVVAQALAERPDLRTLPVAISAAGEAQKVYQKQQFRLSQAPPELEPFEKTPPFYDREDEQGKLRILLERSNVLVVAGLRGVGKRAFLERVLKEVFPRTRPVEISLVSEMTARRFVQHLESVLDLAFDVLKGATEARKRDLANVVIVRDTAHAFANVASALPEIVAALEGTRINVLIATSHAPAQLAVPVLRLGTLAPADAQRLYSYWCNAAGVDEHQIVLRTTYGHPLAIRLAVQRQQEGDASFVGTLRFLTKFREEVFEILLSGTKLTEAERRTLGYLSVFRRPCPPSLVSGSAHVESAALASLEERMLIEHTDEGVSVFSVVNDYIRHEEKDSGHAAAYHTIAAKWYEARIKDAQGYERLLAREEAVYHYTNCGDLQRARELGADWMPEARSAVLNLYRNRDYTRCLSVCEAIISVRPESDVLARSAVCNIRLSRWEPGQARMKEALAMGNVPSSLLVSYGEVVAQKLGDPSWLEKAVEAFPDNAYAFAALSDSFFSKGRVDDAWRAAMESLDVDPECARGLEMASRIARSRRDYKTSYDYAIRAMAVNPAKAADNLRKVIADLRKEMNGRLPEWVDKDLVH
jgi:hypothetical protein